MSDSGSPWTDLLGLKPVGKSLQIMTQAMVDGASALLSRVCLPAAQELGKVLEDKVAGYRKRNLITLAVKLEKKLAQNSTPANAQASPRLFHAILEQAAWIDDDMLQDLWAGLLSSSCTDTGDDDSNLIFVNLLRGLTRLQARILKYACENSTKQVSQAGLLQPLKLWVSQDKLREITAENDLERLDRELDHLRSLDLLPQGGFSTDDAALATVTPSVLALHMYVRCNGSRLSPLEYFGIKPAAPTATNKPNDTSPNK